MRSVRARAVLPDEHAAGRKLACFSKDRERGRNEAEGEERVECVKVDLAREAGHAKQRLQLRCERHGLFLKPVVERLDPEAIAGDDEPAVALVPERDREHPPEPADEIWAVFLVEVDEHLGIAVRRKAMTARAFELRA